MSPVRCMNHGGEGGIRTLGTLLGYTRFPVVRLQPLGHLSLIKTLRTYAPYPLVRLSLSPQISPRSFFWVVLLSCCFQKLTQAFAVANTDREKWDSKQLHEKLIVAHTRSSRDQVNSRTTPGNSRRYSFVADREPSRALGNETLGSPCHDPPQGFLPRGDCRTSSRMDFQPRSAFRLSKSLQCLQL